MVEAGEYQLRLLFDRVRTRIVPQEELEAAGCTERTFFGVNTPDDWATVLAWTQDCGAGA
jgi:molybdopterin-guanine dinucleotide biosynthesis protein A